MLFQRKETVICTSCKFKDSSNSFKENEVTIKASVQSNGDTQQISHQFKVQCAKCKSCGKILFTKMSKFDKVKKEAEKYFKSTYPSSEIKLVSINM